MTTTTRGDPERWRRVDALLTQALALEPAARAVWLAALPEADQPLRPMLERMLARADEPTDGFMRGSVQASVLGEIGGDTAIEKAGAEIGPYRLIRELGSGGMGRVWLAERIDGPLRRQVALKLPRMGWARGVAERLEQERDALAALEHPHIARLYDAGTVQGGRPYIAMEYIDGVPLSEYVIVHHCTLAQRLRLFQQITAAVAYAHANLVVHRDLKPQNILVSADGVVHLLDFGAAKLLGRDEEMHLTRQLGTALSPDYAAPEQIRGERVTVASDIYSLGVLLFELCTGERPYRLQRVTGAALEDAIARADVPRASSLRGLGVREARALRGDLDAIIQKATQGEPARRYASVQALADDLDRHLAGEPVLAQPASAAYRAWKFTKRHRFGVGASAAVLLAIAIGGVVSLWQANEARQQAARAERVKEFVISIFTQAVPKTGVGGTVTAKDLLGVAAQRLDGELADDPGVAAELGVIVANSYDALGYTNETVPILRTAVERAERALGPDAPVTLDARLALVSGIMLDDPAGAVQMLQELMPRVIRHYPDNARRAVQALRYQSFAQAKLNQREESYASLRLAQETAERFLGRDDEETIFVIGLLSNTYGRFGDRADQLRTATEALQRATRAFGAKRPHNTLIAVERWYADALRENDRPGDAVPILRRVVADQLKLDGAVTQRVRNAKLQLGNALGRVGAAGESLALLREAVALEREQNPTDTDDRAGFGEAFAAALALAHRVDEALAQDAYLEDLATRLPAARPRLVVANQMRHARLLVLDGRPAEALPILDRLETLAATEDAEMQFQLKLNRAFTLRQMGDAAASLRIVRAAIAAPEYASLRLALRSGLQTELGLALLDQGDSAAARAPLEQCERLYVKAQIQPSVRVAGCILGLARVRLAEGRAAEAAALLQPLLASWRAANPGSAWEGETLYWLAQAQRAGGNAAEAERTLRSAREMLRSGKAPYLRELSTRAATEA